MANIPDDVLQAAVDRYQATVDESDAYALDLQALVAGIYAQITAAVASKIPAEYGLTVTYQPNGVGFSTNEAQRFTLTADNIAPILLTVQAPSGARVDTELTVGGASFTEMQLAVGYARKLYEAQQAAAAEQANQPAVELQTYEQ